MITPQRKSFPAVQTPRKIFGTRVLNSAIDSKGKAVAFAGVMKPPQIDSIRDKKSFVRTPVNVGYADDWRRFKEVGLLNEASMEKKERQALLEKVSKLEKELFDYQHNMGLLLIEKRNWISENEELSQALAEVEEILKREKTANLIALSEAEKREENLRKALIDENQSVAELKFALRRPQEKHCQAKVAYETKLAEANSMIVGVEQKAIHVEKLRHVAEEKLVEVNRKETEVEKKLKEVEIRESLLQLERLSFVTEQETHEATVYKLREELSGREKRLTVEERKLSELEQHLNEKDEKIVENEGSLKDKEMSLELAIEENEKSSDEGFLRKQEELKQQEAEINHMKEELSKKETFLNKKSEEVMEKELELEARWKYVKEKEESFKAEETRLQMEKRKLDDERRKLCELKDEIEGIEAETAQRELRVYEEQEKLKVTKEERSGFIRLQFELKQQMEKCGQQEELLLKEHEGLREERNKFEIERSLLEEKRAEISKEHKETSEGKKKLETQQPSEEKGLKGEVTYPRDYKRKELDHIKRHEKALDATTVNENRMQEENEKDLGIRVANFELRCLKQLGKKDLSKKLAQIEMENVHSERLSPERQRKEEQTEMHKDIDEQTENVSDLALLKKLPSSTQIYDAVMEAGDGFETSAAHNSHMEVRNVETSNASQYSDRNTYKRRGKPKKSKTQSSLAKNATEEVSIEGNSRKRQHEQTSKRIVIEQDGNEKDCHAHSLTAGGRRKRKQITSQIPPSPVQHHYNLRSRNKNSERGLISVVREDGACGDTQAKVDSLVVSVPSLGDGENGESKETTVLTTFESLDFSKDKSLRVET